MVSAAPATDAAPVDYLSSSCRITATTVRTRQNTAATTDDWARAEQVGQNLEEWREAIAIIPSVKANTDCSRSRQRRHTDCTKAYQVPTMTVNDELDVRCSGGRTPSVFLGRAGVPAVVI